MLLASPYSMQAILGAIWWWRLQWPRKW